MTNIPIETVRTDSFSMNYICFGKGKETLVILPGLSVQSVLSFADDVAQAYSSLADDFTIYLFDRRNELPASYSVYDMAHDMAEIFKALEFENICLFGASQGGMIAMNIAIDNPELVQKMVLASTTSRISDERFRTLDEWISSARDGNKKELYLAFGEAVYPIDVFQQSRQLLTEAANTVTDEDLERFVILAEGMRDFDVTDLLDKIACPVLLIGSEDDKVLGADSALQIKERMKERQDFEFYMYNGYGHAVYDTAPDFKERILRFLISHKMN